jgi:hypothetical protein
MPIMPADLARRTRFSGGPSIGFAAALAMLLAACSGPAEQPIVQSPDVEETVATGPINLSPFRYTGPESPPIDLQPLVVEAPPGEVEGWLSGVVSLAGFTPMRSPAGQFAAVYRGDAGRFVDCGWIDVPGVGTTPATASSWSMAADSPPGMTITREIQLHARLAAELAAMGTSATRIDPTIHYVLVKRVVAIDRNGTVVVDQRDVIDFAGGDSSRFLVGTKCQSSGALETALFSILPRRVASGGPSGRGPSLETGPT